MDTNIFGAVDQFINNLFVKEDAALQQTKQAIIDGDLPLISISENQGKFLHILARLSNAKKILEIGTLGGYSTIWLGRALQEGGQLISLELDQHHADVALANISNAGLGNKVNIRVGNALEELPKMKKEGAGPFDLIFIDADKEPYAEYFELALQLSRPGTLIIADNVVREGKILEENSTDTNVTGVQRFIKRMAATSGVTATIIQTVGSKYHDGMALAIVNEAV
ncbi:O-methyltransferase [Agriterribacter sp.]|uniref:O-methyltransferase n=1 Tax=Agriterribacter sp. TaxID=2821509 RepID=UPI002BF4C42A|nr:O-methyltransferase [Agriterribacter sp.]HRO44212.1 O-methyltransferase [Agriterribacter sp.]HRQ19060.1 O-methyltransferase [Agriterribacter sp.]